MGSEYNKSEKGKARFKRYREKHKDRIKASQKAYRDKNREQVRKADRTRSEEVNERKRKRKAESRQEEIDKIGKEAYNAKIREAAKRRRKVLDDKLKEYALLDAYIQTPYDLIHWNESKGLKEFVNCTPKKDEESKDRFVFMNAQYPPMPCCLQTADSPLQLCEHNQAKLCGMTDADGCLSIYKTTRDTYYSQITLRQACQTGVPLEFQYVKHLLNNQTTLTLTKREGKHKNCWTQNIPGRLHNDFCIMMIHHAHIKDAEAKVILEFRNLSAQEKVKHGDHFKTLINQCKKQRVDRLYTNNNVIPSYLGGLITGDGCIQINKSNDIRLQIMALEAPGLLKRIQEIYGGSFSWANSSIRGKVLSEIHWTSAKAIKYIREWSPFMFGTKQVSCYIALQAYEYREWFKKEYSYKLVPRDNEQLYIYNRLCKMIKKL